MNKRTFLIAALGIATFPALSVEGHAEADPLCPASTDPDLWGTLEKGEHSDLGVALPQIYRQKPVSLVAQHMHDDAVTLAFLFSPPHIEMMKQAGKKHLVVEMPLAFNQMFDAVANGHMSPQELALQASIPWLQHPHLRTRIMRTVGMGLLMMKKAGISVFCCDTSLTDSTPEDLKVFDRFLKGTGPENREANARILAARLDDRKRLSLIREATKDQPSVIALGVLHMQDHATSMKTLIGTQNCLHTNLYGDQQIYVKANNSFCRSQSDFVGIIETNMLYRTGATPLAVPKVSRAAQNHPAIA